ncbi:MAG TPA: LysE family transporter [Acidobacteriota bacterium]|nr:LysE family transporter [Acidobacteriota bacterium]
MFFKGLLIGFAIAVPVGPIGFLCLRRTLIYGRITGLVSGLGAATADALYGLVAALGLTAISSFLIRMESWLQFFGGIFLVILGLKTALTKPPAKDAAEPAAPPPTRSWQAAYVSTLALTLTSPATIIAFVAIFAGVGLGASNTSPLHALEIVSGVFLGSATWWLLLSFGAGALRDRLHARTLHVMHVVSGLGIMALGLWQGVLLVSKWLG